MASLGIKQIQVAQALDNMRRAQAPDMAQREAARLSNEHQQMLGSMDMGLRHQQMKLEERKFAEQQRQAQFDRHKELIALEAEYGALMGQETKAPTDPRLTQTHKVATMKGQYGRQGDVAKRMTEQQKRNLDLMKLIQKGEQFGTKEERFGKALEERIRHNKVMESIGRSRAASAGRLRDSFNAQRTIQALNNMLSKIDADLKGSATMSQIVGRGEVDRERVKKLIAERDQVSKALKDAIQQATQMSGIAAQLGAMDTGGVPGMEAYGTGMGGGAPQGGELREEDFPFEGGN